MSSTYSMIFKYYEFFGIKRPEILCSHFILQYAHNLCRRVLIKKNTGHVLYEKIRFSDRNSSNTLFS